MPLTELQQAKLAAGVGIALGSTYRRAHLMQCGDGLPVPSGNATCCGGGTGGSITHITRCRKVNVLAGRVAPRGHAQALTARANGWNGMDGRNGWNEGMEWTDRPNGMEYSNGSMEWNGLERNDYRKLPAAAARAGWCKYRLQAALNMPTLGQRRELSRHGDGR